MPSQAGSSHEFLGRDGFDYGLHFVDISCACWLFLEGSFLCKCRLLVAQLGCDKSDPAKLWSIYHLTAVVIGCTAHLLHAHSVEKEHILSPCYVIRCFG